MSAATVARIQEVSMCFGKRRQTNIATANILADIWSLQKVNPVIVNPQFVVETDEDDLGKGDEYPTQTFASHVDVSGAIEKYNSADFLAWCVAFGLGGVTPSGAYIYTCIPTVAITDGVELPYFTYLEAIRQGADLLFDRKYVGCALNDFLVSITTGPGRGSSRITANWIGCGEIVDPSAITHPAKSTEQALSGGSVAISIQTVDYITVPTLVSLNWGWNNNINPDTGFFPGSGYCAAATIFRKRGRLEARKRQGILNFIVRMTKNSVEYTALKAGTTGTAVITQTFDEGANYTATFHQVGFQGVEIAEGDGYVTLSVNCLVEKHATNGVLTVVAECETANICALPA